MTGDVSTTGPPGRCYVFFGARMAMETGSDPKIPKGVGQALVQED